MLVVEVGACRCHFGKSPHPVIKYRHVSVRVSKLVQWKHQAQLSQQLDAHPDDEVFEAGEQKWRVRPWDSDSSRPE